MAKAWLASIVSWKYLIIPIILSLIYPCCIFVVMRKNGIKEVIKWWQNDLAFNAFSVVIFPWAVFFFFRGFKVEIFKEADYAGLILLAVFLFLAVILVWKDFFRGNLSSSHMYISDKPKELCKIYRAKNNPKSLMVPHSLILQLRHPKDSQQIKTVEKARDEYLKIAPPFKSFSDLVNNGSISAYAALLWNYITILFVAFFLWYAVFVYKVISLGFEDILINLILSAILMSFWFPMRLYSDWYINFYILPDLKKYSAYWLLSIIFVLVVAIFVFLHFKSQGTAIKILASLNAVFAILFGIIAKSKPSILLNIADVIEEFSPLFFFAGVVIVASTLFCIVNNVLT